jgi:hypothetical protein
MKQTLVRAGAALALLGALALPGSANNQEPVTMSLTCKGPNPKATRPALQLAGQAELPNGAVLKLAVIRHYESWDMNKLRTMKADSGAQVVRVESRKFAGQRPVGGAGIYAVRVDLIDEFQNDLLIKQVKGLTPKEWNFTFQAFGEDMVGQLEPKLKELEELGTETLGVLKDFLNATKDGPTWKGAETDLEPRLKKLRKQLGESTLTALYPAGLSQLHDTIQKIHQNLPYLVFAEGKFAGAKDYHAGDSQVKTHREEPFTHDNFRRYVEEAPLIAGREACLWVLGEVRRSGSLKPDVAEAIKGLSKKGGVAEFYERLSAVKLEEVDALEKAVRTAPLGAPPDPKKKNN